MLFPFRKVVRGDSPTRIALRVAALCCFLLCANAEPPESPNVQFVDVTKASGVEFRHQNSVTALKYLIEAVTGGVGLLDYDNDGWLDIYAINAAPLADPQPDGKPIIKTGTQFWNRLYRNNHDGTFSDATEKAGLQGAGYGMGVATGDYDNDGFTDILVTTYGGAYLYHNNQGTFTDITKKAGIATDGWNTSAAFVDYDNDGFLDLFVARYLKWDFSTGAKYCGAKTEGGRAYCHPNEFEPISNYLFHNNGDGTFRDVSQSSGIGKHEGKALGVAINDFNQDGWLDIYVANDSHPQFLFQNKGDGTFEENALFAGVAYSEDGKTFAGMGTDFADVDQDGFPDIVTTALPHESYAFFRNNGDATFQYSSFSSKLSELSRQFGGWGMRILDYNNDGMRDVFLANSHVMDNIEVTQPNDRYLQEPLLLEYRQNEFLDVSKKSGEVFSQRWASRGAAFGDLDNDGDIDVVISTCNGPMHVLRNDGGNRNAWIELDLQGVKSNRDGLGAKLTLTMADGRKQYGIATTASSYLSANDRRVLFGLGPGGGVREIQIRWPSGVEQTISGPRVNQILKIKEQTQ